MVRVLDSPCLSSSCVLSETFGKMTQFACTWYVVVIISLLIVINGYDLGLILKRAIMYSRRLACLTVHHQSMLLLEL